MIKALRSPWTYCAASVVAVSLFFSTTSEDDIRLKLQVISGAPFQSVAPGMLYEVTHDAVLAAPSPLCQLQDVDASAQVREQHRRVFYNVIGSTVPVLPQLGVLFGEQAVPSVAIELDYTVVALNPDFRGDIRADCEARAINAIERHKTTICVVDSVVQTNGDDGGLFGVRFKPWAFAPNWTGETPPRCGLALYRKGILAVRQIFIADGLV